MPFGEIGIDECFQRALLGEQLGANLRHLIAGGPQGLLYQFVLGLEMRVKATVSQAQGFHQGLQTGRADTVTAKAY
ncbi:hypothetical protein D3C72_2510970 [compost metagenome]